MKTHVVVTVYTAPTGNVVTHAYGPYTISKAQYERLKLIRDNTVGDRLQVSACRMLDY